MPKVNREKDEFDAVPARVYTDEEIRDFHSKIQIFWDGSREVFLDKGMGGLAQKFRHEVLHVAYGAARRVEQGKKEDGSPVFHYLYNPERYEEFENLWTQYEVWRKKQDWIKDKQMEGYEQTAEQIPF